MFHANFQIITINHQTTYRLIQEGPPNVNSKQCKK